MADVTNQSHSDRKHAFLSASGASRWMACPPSAVAGKGIADKTSPFAEEGTVAHELSELYFEHIYNGLSKEVFEQKLAQFKTREYYSVEMDIYVRDYVDFVEERVNIARARDEETLTTLFEKRLDLEPYVPESFGTGDVLVYSGGVLEIIDLKYGKGVAVSAVNNPQLRLYGLGASSMLREAGLKVDKVIMTIVQPRLDSITSDEMLFRELHRWGVEIVRPLAEKAMKGEGNYNPGEHCRFCKFKTRCRARAESIGVDLEVSDPGMMSHVELEELLAKADDIIRFYQDIKTYAQERAKKGVEFKGFKLVHGKSNRKLSDTTEAEMLLRAIYPDEDVFEPRKMKSIAQLEKTIGKGAVQKEIGHLVVKPLGAPTLVPYTDKRPPISDIDTEFDIITE